MPTSLRSRPGCARRDRGSRPSTSRSACRGRWSRRSAGRATGCALTRHYTGLSRAEIRATFQAFCAARPVGNKFAHRACDAFSTASPSMKWVNPPVAFMLHAGIGLLLDAGVQISTLHPGDPGRVALEGYPGLLARELIGRRSYKSDTRAMQTPARRDARVELLAPPRSRREPARPRARARRGAASGAARRRLGRPARRRALPDAGGLGGRAAGLGPARRRRSARRLDRQRGPLRRIAAAPRPLSRP